MSVVTVAICIVAALLGALGAEVATRAALPSFAVWFIALLIALLVVAAGPTVLQVG